MKALKTLFKSAVVVGATVGAAASQAAVDTAPVLSGLSDAQTAAVAIGTAVLGIAIAIKTFKYIRQAF